MLYQHEPKDLKSSFFKENLICKYSFLIESIFLLIFVTDHGGNKHTDCLAIKAEDRSQI